MTRAPMSFAISMALASRGAAFENGDAFHRGFTLTRGPSSREWRCRK